MGRSSLLTSSSAVEASTVRPSGSSDLATFGGSVVFRRSGQVSSGADEAKWQAVLPAASMAAQQPWVLLQQLLNEVRFRVQDHFIITPDCRTQWHCCGFGLR